MRIALFTLITDIQILTKQNKNIAFIYLNSLNNNRDIKKEYRVNISTL